MTIPLDELISQIRKMKETRTAWHDVVVCTRKTYNQMLKVIPLTSQRNTLPAIPVFVCDDMATAKVMVHNMQREGKNPFLVEENEG